MNDYNLPNLLRRPDRYTISDLQNMAFYLGNFYQAPVSLEKLFTEIENEQSDFLSPEYFTPENLETLRIAYRARLN